VLCFERRIVCSIVYKYSPYHLFIVKRIFSIVSAKILKLYNFPSKSTIFSQFISNFAHNLI
jgi:hypothetical protein